MAVYSRYGKTVTASSDAEANKKLKELKNASKGTTRHTSEQFGIGAGSDVYFINTDYDSRGKVISKSKTTYVGSGFESTPSSVTPEVKTLQATATDNRTGTQMSIEQSKAVSGKGFGVQETRTDREAGVSRASNLRDQLNLRQQVYNPQSRATSNAPVKGTAYTYFSASDEPEVLGSSFKEDYKQPTKPNTEAFGGRMTYPTTNRGDDFLTPTSKSTTTSSNKDFIAPTLGDKQEREPITLFGLGRGAGNIIWEDMGGKGFGQIATTEASRSYKSDLFQGQLFAYQKLSGKTSTPKSMFPEYNLNPVTNKDTRRALITTGFIGTSVGLNVAVPALGYVFDYGTMGFFGARQARATIQSPTNRNIAGSLMLGIPLGLEVKNVGTGMVRAREWNPSNVIASRWESKDILAGLNKGVDVRYEVFEQGQRRTNLYEKDILQKSSVVQAENVYVIGRGGNKDVRVLDVINPRTSTRLVQLEGSSSKTQIRFQSYEGSGKTYMDVMLNDRVIKTREINPKIKDIGIMTGKPQRNIFESIGTKSYRAEQISQPISVQIDGTLLSGVVGSKVEQTASITKPYREFTYGFNLEKNTNPVMKRETFKTIAKFGSPETKVDTLKFKMIQTTPQRLIRVSSENQARLKGTTHPRMQLDLFYSTKPNIKRSPINMNLGADTFVSTTKQSTQTGSKTISTSSGELKTMQVQEVKVQSQQAQMNTQFNKQIVKGISRNIAIEKGGFTTGSKFKLKPVSMAKTRQTPSTMVTQQPKQQSMFNNMFIPSMKTQTMQGTMLKNNQRQSPFSMQKNKQNLFQANKLLLNNKQNQLQAQSYKQDLIQNQITTTSMQNETPITTRPIEVIPPVKTPLWFGGGRGSLGKSLGFNIGSIDFKSVRTPSLTALAFNIRSPKAVRGERTGLVIRPIVGG